MAGRRVCPHCKYLNDEDDLYCRFCRQELTPSQSLAPPVPAAEPEREAPSKAMQTCPWCGRETPAELASCLVCGKPIPGTARSRSPSGRRKCPACGRGIRDDSVFCEYCGFRLVSRSPMW